MLSLKKVEAEPKATLFREIRAGECFTNPAGVYVKTEDGNAFCLSGCCLVGLAPDSTVKRAKATLEWQHVE